LRRDGSSRPEADIKGFSRERTYIPHLGDMLGPVVCIESAHMLFAENINDIEKVEAALGYWPTFHDAEVISFTAERALPFKSGFTLARLAVNVRRYETIGQGAAQYEQVLRKSVLVRFVFNGACEFELSDFNHQNVINSISVTRAEGNEAAPLQVDIESIWGFGGTLRCSSALVEAVEVLNITDA
jgi:hypothetical protein